MYPPDHFDMIWASPPCTQYPCARTSARTPRCLAGSDRLVQQVLDIIMYFSPIDEVKPLFFIENPWSGLLRHRSVVSQLPPPKMLAIACMAIPIGSTLQSGPIQKSSLSVVRMIATLHPSVYQLAELDTMGVPSRETISIVVAMDKHWPNSTVSLQLYADTTVILFLI